MLTTVKDLKARGPHLSVGVHSADFMKLGEELSEVQRAGVQVLHFDIMDGVFCPQMTFGPTVVAAVPDTFIKDVHLMIDDPIDKVDDYVKAGASILTFHLEATRHPHRILQSLSGSGVQRGVAINPGTPIEAVIPLLDDLELILVLSVNPGWGGQRFIRATTERIRKLMELIEGRDILLGIDGGITQANLNEVVSLGVDLLISGSAVFDGVQPFKNAQLMIKTCQQIVRERKNYTWHSTN